MRPELDRFGERQDRLGGTGGLRDGTKGSGGLIAGELVGPVDDHLRRVGTVEMEVLDVGGLPLGELVRGETVVPAERIPVVDVLFHDEDLGVGDGLLALQPGEESVGGRATGTALRGEELDEDWSAGGLRDNRSCGKRQEAEDREKQRGPGCECHSG